MKTFKCPSCNANLSFSDDREFGFCEYCGTKILLGDYSINYVTKHIVDEAALKNAEIREKELRFEERKFNIEMRKNKIRNTFKTIYWVSAIFITILGNILYENNSKDGFTILIIGISLLLFGFLDYIERNN